ncbi:MAG: acyl carrier protein [Lachnospiraceae bacterium]|nr:acyl carrier protein [Lachnospiraceae bacterium]
MDRIFELLSEAIIEIMQCDVSELKMDTSFEKDLGMDSLDAYQVLLRVEEELSVKIPPEKVEKLVTIEDALSLIQSVVEKSGEGDNND